MRNVGHLISVIKIIQGTYSDLFVLNLQIADGMAYLGANNCIHRDLRARHIVVGPNNEVKVAHFQLARIIRGN
ncbi:hypothetical protein DPMN_057064 [Dreissena polymorpha]|uniref:Protein kinase domain-containing protein n=1 Tax=Dreissena polymorpha TaxID=45954 RepID=A0A9D4CSX0_DREPO|nr:hypothetical protein DPMN_057064 [Dreissena polymorpha]